MALGLLSSETVKLCVFLTEREIMRRYAGADEVPALPSTDTFERTAASIPPAYVMYFREGQKKFIGECAP